MIRVSFLLWDISALMGSKHNPMTGFMWFYNLLNEALETAFFDPVTDTGGPTFYHCKDRYNPSVKADASGRTVRVKAKKCVQGIEEIQDSQGSSRRHAKCPPVPSMTLAQVPVNAGCPSGKICARLQTQSAHRHVCWAVSRMPTPVLTGNA